MESISSYLTFDGNTEEVFNFYKSVFGGKFIDMNRYSEHPESDNLDEKEKNKIMHVALKISNNNILMGSDISSLHKKNYKVGNNFQLSIKADNYEEAKKIFSSLSYQGKVQMPLEITFWNAYFGMLTDQYGIQWLINCECIK